MHCEGGWQLLKSSLVLIQFRPKKMSWIAAGVISLNSGTYSEFQLPLRKMTVDIPTLRSHTRQINDHVEIPLDT